MTDNIRHRLDQILNRDFDSLSLNNLPDPNSILDRQLFTKLIDFYQSCMNQDPIEFKNITPLYPLFRSIRAFIPIDGGSVTKQGLNGAIQYLAEQNIWTLFELKVEPDIIYNPSKSINSLHQGHVGLSSYDDEDVTRVYMQTVISILDMIFKKDINNEFGWKSWSTIATARRIVEFEKKIASASAFEKEQPRRWSMDELEERVPQINWKQLLPTITTHVLIPHTNWIHHLNDQVLSDTNPRTLQMYFIWRSIWKYIDTLGEEFQVPKRKLDAKISGIEPRATPERWTTCIDLMDKSSMGVLLGRYFITDQQQSSIKETKEKVELLAKRIVKIIEDRVPHLSWLSEDDQVSKNEILAKVSEN
jgi:predicted metalloendopeptidase